MLGAKNMGWVIFVGIIIYGWVEFEALFFVGDAIGGLASFLGIFVTALIGLSLLRSQGNAVMQSMRSQMARGQTGLSQMADSLSLVLGAILMLVPGYVTDSIGLICFIPGVRSIIGAFLLKRMAGRIMNVATKQAGFGFSNYSANGNPFSSNPFSGPSYSDMDDSNQNFPFGNQSDTMQSGALNDDFIEGEYSEKSDEGSEKFDEDKR